MRLFLATCRRPGRKPPQTCPDKAKNVIDGDWWRFQRGNVGWRMDGCAVSDISTQPAETDFGLVGGRELVEDRAKWKWSAMADMVRHIPHRDNKAGFAFHPSSLGLVLEGGRLKPWANALPSEKGLAQLSAEPVMSSKAKRFYPLTTVSDEWAFLGVWVPIRVKRRCIQKPCSFPTLETSPLDLNDSHSLSMATILSPEILRLIAHHIQHSNSSAGDLAAFALGARALAKAADPYRLRSIRVDGLEDLQNVCRSLQMEWRCLGVAVSELVVRLGPSNGKGKLAASPSPALSNPAAELLARTLQSTRRLTKLDIEVDSSSISFDQVLPSLASRSLRHLALHTTSPLSTNTLDRLLRSQPHLTHLELPNQHQAYPPEPIVASPPPPQKSFKAIAGDGRRKRLRLCIARPVPAASHCSTAVLAVPSLAKCQGTSSSSVLLNRLQSVRAPVSLLLSLPSTSPLQSVVTTDDDIPRSVQRRFFEKLGEHGVISGTKLLHLEVTLHERSMSLGVMQEITRNLRELESLVVRSVVKDAYFTYFLQDLAGCLSRCQQLRSLTFDCPAEYPYRDGRGREAVCRYTSLPNTDPSIPLPSLAARFSSFDAHLYPPNGPEVFHREQYIVNLYGTTNPRLRAVTMPAGTIWRWSHDEDDRERRVSASPAPTLRERCPSPPTSSFDPHAFADPPAIALPELAKPHPLSLTLAPVEKQQSVAAPPAVVVPSSPVADGRRQASPALSTAWGWEPDVACVEARAWWEECGLKPFHSASPGVSETEIDEYDCEMDDTDVDEEDEDEEMDHDDRVALFHPYPPRTNSKIVMPVEILDDEPIPAPTIKAAVISSSPRPNLKRKAVDEC